MNARELVDLYEEYGRRIAEREFALNASRADAHRQRTRVAALESFIREQGHEVAEAEQAWKAKGYGGL